MTRRRPRLQSAVARQWERSAPTTRLAWALTGAVLAVALLAHDWPPRSALAVVFPVQMFTACALGAARAWFDRRAARDGRPTPRWQPAWLYTGVWAMAGSVAVAWHHHVRGWLLLLLGGVFLRGCYCVLLGFFGPGTSSAVPPGQRAASGDLT